MKGLKVTVLSGLTAGALLTLAGAASANSRYSNHGAALGSELRQDRQEIRDGQKQLQTQLRQLERAKMELSQKIRRGASPREIARARAEIHKREKAIAATRRQLSHDIKDYREDLWRYQNRYGSRDFDRYGGHNRNHGGPWNGWWGWGR